MWMLVNRRESLWILVSPCESLREVNMSWMFRGEVGELELMFSSRPTHLQLLFNSHSTSIDCRSTRKDLKGFTRIHKDPQGFTKNSQGFTRIRKHSQGFTRIRKENLRKTSAKPKRIKGDDPDRFARKQRSTCMQGKQKENLRKT